MKKFDKRTAFFMGMWTFLVLFVIDIWIISSLTKMAIAKSLTSSLLTGVLVALLVGYTFKRIMKPRAFMTNIKIETMPEEKILLDAPANHIKGWERVGGKLFLTNQRLVFKSHRLNFRNLESTINLDLILMVEQYRIQGLDNGLNIQTKDHQINKFIVENTED